MKKNLLKTIIFVLLLGLPFFGAAHIPNQSYVYLRIYEKQGIEGHFELNVNEINKIFGLSLDKNTSLEELGPYIEDIKTYLLQHTSFDSEFGEHKIKFGETDLLYLNLGNFLLLDFHLENTNTLPENLNVGYSAVFDKDATHKGFLIIEYNWKAGIINNEANILLDFGPGDTKDSFSLTEVSIWKGFVAMVKQGIWHIWIGLDHILFLLALILPSVVRRAREKESVERKINVWGWTPVLKFRPAFLYIIKVITFFTIAHTITLTLASLEIVTLPSRIVESIIAFSIGLAAYHNIRPIFKGRDWVIAFVFGLFHGFGFASVLSDLGLTGEFLTLSLLGFNVGVEIGQLVIIAMIFPILYLIRKSRFYPKILVYGSIFLIIVSLYWCIERVFDVNLGIEDYIRSTAYKTAVYLGLR
ncbi:MAG: HupE/UreJ family protein [Bacteroidota bacterium]